MTNRSSIRESSPAAPAPQPRPPLPSAPSGQSPVVHDWLRMQQSLLEAERELAGVAERYARGAATGEELDEASQRAVALRELSLAVLQRLRRG